jgi:RecB family endonuclease NucS
MSETNLQGLLTSVNCEEIRAGDLEILGEKALPAGHIDILLKQRVPLGSGPKIPIEVKTKKAQPKDLSQLRGYMGELRGECPIGLLIASDFHKQVIAGAKDADIKLVRYALAADLTQTPTFEEIHQGLSLEYLNT